MTIVTKRIDGITTYHYRTQTTETAGKVLIIETDNPRILGEIIKKQRGKQKCKRALDQ